MENEQHKLITVLVTKMLGKQAFIDQYGNQFECYDSWRFAEGDWYFVQLLDVQKAIAECNRSVEIDEGVKKQGVYCYPWKYILQRIIPVPNLLEQQ